MKPTEIALARLVAQRLVGPPLADPAAVVQWMTCMQAQDFPGARTSVALRTGSRSLAAVEAALNSGAVVRSWPMRGTAHFVPAQDLGWMLELTSERTLRSVEKRHTELGRPADWFDQAQAVAQQALDRQPNISREALSDLWRQAGLIEEPQDTYRCVFHLCQRGVLCLGPVVSGKQHLVLLQRWVSSPRRLERDEALTEWALRYFRSHGPAPVKDFAWWTKLPAAQVKTAVAAAREHLHAETVEGVEVLMDPATPDLLAQHRQQARGTLLLPGFDEFVLGYGNRDPFLDREHASKLVPGGNGVFKASIVHQGRIIGTWKHAGTGAKRHLEATVWADAGLPAATERTYTALPS